jgi:hypothetical protein
MIDAFISYSHKNLEILERLHTHLAVMNRERRFASWYDRNILAGGELDAIISEELQKCNLFIAIVSPDFLASNYCYDKEMKTAISLHDKGQIRIVPIIAEPCDWKNTPLRRFKALPVDGKPIADFPNINTALLEVVEELRRIADSISLKKTQPQENNPFLKATKKPVYKIKREFDQFDKTDFRDKSYKIIRDYLKAQVEEIANLEGIRARFSDIDAQAFTCAVLNKTRQNLVGHLTLYAQSNRIFGDISYSYSENPTPNSSNGSLRIEWNDYELFLKKGFSIFGNDSPLTALQAAEILWKELLERAGIQFA